MSSPQDQRSRSPWRVVVGVLLIAAGLVLFVFRQVTRDGTGGAGLDGLVAGLVVALGVVALQRPQR